MHIREIQAGDRAEWLRLLLALYAGSRESDHAPIVDAFMEERGCQWLVPSAVFVCERPGPALCGFLELSVRNYAEGCVGPAPCIESWYVEPGARGTGIGRRLVQAAEQWALARGFDTLASDAELGNTQGHRAHEAVGFVEEERVVHYRKKIGAGV